MRFPTQTISTLRRIAVICATLALAACGSDSTAPPAVASIDLAPASVSISVGETATLQAVPRSAAGEMLTVPTVLWGSASSSIASVSPGGLVTGVSPGSTMITASAGGISRQVDVTVRARPHIAVSSSTVTLAGSTISSPGSTTIAVTNSGGGVMTGLAIASTSYTAGAKSGWLSATLGGAGVPATLNLQATSVGLTPGLYTAVVALTAANADNGPVQVNVTMNVVAPVTLNVVGTGSGTGSIASSPTGIACTITNGSAGASGCSADFNPGTSITLNATASSGSAFSGWSGDCSGTGACTVTMSATRSVTANFTHTAVPPVVTTAAADNIASTKADLHGSVAQDGSAYTVWFEWSTNSAMATFTTGAASSGPTTNCPATATCNWSMTVSSLIANTTYYYRLAASNSGGTTRGSIRSFTTAASAPPQIQIVSSANVTTTVGSRIDMTARVTNGDGTRAVGASVTWDVPGYSSTTLQTDSNGESAVYWTASSAGSFTGTATLVSTGAKASFAFTVTGSGGTGGTGGTGGSGGTFPIEVRFVGSVSSAVRTAAQQAAARLQQVLIGTPSPAAQTTVDLSGCGETWLSGSTTETFRGLVIYLGVAPIDGSGHTLAQAGPCYTWTTNHFPFVATATFDEADQARPANDLYSILLHEFMHAAGFGASSMWRANLGGAGTSNPYFTGTKAYAGWPAAGGTNYYINAVPVENTGGSGTADAHWRESIMGSEVMTGYSTLGETVQVSVMTIGAFADMGYTVNMSAADAYRVPGPRLRTDEATAEPFDRVKSASGSLSPIPPRAGATQLRRPPR